LLLCGNTVSRSTSRGQRRSHLIWPGDFPVEKIMKISHRGNEKYRENGPGWPSHAQPGSVVCAIATVIIRVPERGRDATIDRTPPARHPARKKPGGGHVEPTGGI